TDAKYEKEREKRNKLFGSMRITSELLEKSDKHVLFMHCLPAFREREVADAVIEGPHSVVFDEAENRLHVQKAILTMLLWAGELRCGQRIQSLESLKLQSCRIRLFMIMTVPFRLVR